MKNWKEEFKKQFTYLGEWNNYIDIITKRKVSSPELIIKFTESLLAEQKKELMEKLDDMAFENDNGYKVELFINWDEANKRTMKALSMEDVVIHGNCLEELPKISKQLNGKFIIVTDPPFNIGYHYNNYSDNLGADEYYQMLQEVFSYSPFVVIHYPEEIYKISFQVGMFPEKVVSWVYNSNTAKQHRDIAFFGVKPDFKKYGQDYKNPTDKRIMKRIADGKRARLYDWWEINQVKNVSKDKTDHPCQMPLEVMKRIIGILPEEYTIVDPFAGSGTTSVACKELGRKFIMIEQDQKYIDIINKRLLTKENK